MVRFNAIKIKHQALNNDEPFTEKESEKYTKKDRSFIRDIQLLNNIPKSRAIRAFERSKKGAEEGFKDLQRRTRAAIRANYPKHKVLKAGRVKTAEEQHRKIPTKRESESHKVDLRKSKAFINAPKNRNKVNYEKVKQGHKKYPDASPSELQHGVNSKWSADYRERNGLPRKYTGRTIK